MTGAREARKRSVSESYILAFRFLDWWAGTFPDFRDRDQFVSIWSMSIPYLIDIDNDTVDTSDPAAWDDWLHAVAAVLEHLVKAPDDVPSEQLRACPLHGQTLTASEAFEALYQYFCVYWQVGKFGDLEIRPLMSDLYTAAKDAEAGKSSHLWSRFLEVWQRGDLSNPLEDDHRTSRWDSEDGKRTIIHYELPGDGQESQGKVTED